MTVEPGPTEPRERVSALTWWLMGGAVLTLAGIIVLVVFVVSTVLGVASNLSQTPASTPTPTPTLTSDPEPTDAAPDIPDRVTFAAGADLPPDLMPSFSTALIGDPNWTPDPADAAGLDATTTFTHNATGCELYSFQSVSTDSPLDPADDYTNSLVVLQSWYGVTDVGTPTSYFFRGARGSSTVEVAAILVSLDSGASQLTTARGFGASNVALLTTFTCADGASTNINFIELALPSIAVEFLPKPPDPAP